MIELGKKQTLQVMRSKDFGIYLGEPGNSEATVLLPKRQVPRDCQTGDELEVFIYKDSEDRLIATTATPKIEIGGTARLPVKEVAKIGAFLDMGLEKDLLLPFKEQTYQVEQGKECLVALYVDKSHRLAATMKVYPYLSVEAPYGKDDRVEGTIYEISDNLGAFVAVDSRYYGLIPKKDIYEPYHLGDQVSARVVKVREDGKLDLSPRDRIPYQMDKDAETVFSRLEALGGTLPFNDKADPELIRDQFHLSKNAFKRAVGHLLKEGKITITDQSIKIRQEEQ